MRFQLRLAVLILIALNIGGCSPCENTVLAEYPSPSARRKVVVFGRECGATTGFSVRASVLDVESAVGTGEANTFVADTNHGAAPSDEKGRPQLSVRWLSADVVELAHHPKVRTFKSERSVMGITVRYAFLE